MGDPDARTVRNRAAGGGESTRRVRISVESRVTIVLRITRSYALVAPYAGGAVTSLFVHVVVNGIHVLFTVYSVRNDWACTR